VDLAAYADLAVRLVNSAAPGGDDRDGLASVEAYRTLVADRPHLCGQVMPGDLEALRLLREELRLIFAAAAVRQEREVVDGLNALLARYPVHPHIVRHDGEPWHLHLVDSGSVADRHAAGASFGLAGLVTEEGAGRLGACAGSGCPRVFVDQGPARGQRYCSQACASSANVRSFRLPGRRRGGRRPASTAAGRARAGSRQAGDGLPGPRRGRARPR
jgi:predicted RNA-binding Zn ribbon-like protein